MERMDMKRGNMVAGLDNHLLQIEFGEFEES